MTALVSPPPPTDGPHAPSGGRTGSQVRRALLVLAVMLTTAATAGGLALARAGVFADERPDGCGQPGRTMDLYAVQLPNDPVTGQVRLGYGLTAESASYPGPTIEMVEGDCLAITLYNQVPAATLQQLRTDLNHPIGVSLHVHGLKYTQESDGTVHSQSYVPPGESRTYTWYAQPRNNKTGAQGTAGYWWYHDHVVGGPHGTQGIGAGLFGGVVVRRPGDPLPDRTYTVAFGDRQTINLRRSPYTDTCDHDNPQPGPTCLVAKQGEHVEFIVISIGNDMHTFHLHGHSWADTRTGLAPNGQPFADSIPVIDNKSVGPGDTFGFQVVAGESVGPGHWMLHCHIQFHSDAGMSTMFHVLDESGAMAAVGDAPVGNEHHH